MSYTESATKTICHIQRKNTMPETRSEPKTPSRATGPVVRARLSMTDDLFSGYATVDNCL